MVDIGEITPEEARSHPQKNIIMQAVGVSTIVTPDVYTLDYRGEPVLLCSDGLSNMVCDGAIAAAVEQNGADTAAAGRLVDMANDAGGTDNISVVLMQNNNGNAGDEHE